MKAQPDRRHRVPLLIIGIGMVIFAAFGFARIVGWMPKAAGSYVQGIAFDGLRAAWAGPAAETAPTAVSTARGNARCAECGVIESTRQTEEREGSIGAAGGPRVSSTGREITVRLSDGSRHVIETPGTADWRPDQRVVVIGGM